MFGALCCTLRIRPDLLSSTGMISFSHLCLSLRNRKKILDKRWAGLNHKKYWAHILHPCAWYNNTIQYNPGYGHSGSLSSLGHHIQQTYQVRGMFWSGSSSRIPAGLALELRIVWSSAKFCNWWDISLSPFLFTGRIRRILDESRYRYCQ